MGQLLIFVRATPFNVCLWQLFPWSVRQSQAQVAYSQAQANPGQKDEFLLRRKSRQTMNSQNDQKVL